ncbi:MAG: hypothetical protein NTY47_06935 [Candidatus Omnitrophica bacterium]|nr:hypothetical protein [Candidatus Omnitrophota bacterium]
MKQLYLDFDDPRILEEIDKHKWIESQKAGRDIGFETAAEDWMIKHGAEWSKRNSKFEANEDISLERRKLRRVELDSCVTLLKDGSLFPVEAVNVSLNGLLCRSKGYIYPYGEVVIRLPFKDDHAFGLTFKAFIERVFLKPDLKEFEVFLKFDDFSRKKLECFEGIKKSILCPAV